MADNRKNNPYKESPWPRDPYSWAGEVGVGSGPVPIQRWRPMIEQTSVPSKDEDPSDRYTRPERRKRAAQ